MPGDRLRCRRARRVTGGPRDELRRRRSEKWLTFGPDVLPAFVAELDVPIAEPVRRALVEAVGRGDLGYVTPAGLPEAFAGWALRTYGWEVDPADVHVVPEVMAGIVEVLRAAGEPGGAVVINPPVYPPFFSDVPEAGRRVVEVPLARDADGWVLDLDGLAAAFRAGARTYLLCSPHNPLGRVWRPDELTAVVELADRYGVLLLGDASYLAWLDLRAYGLGDRPAAAIRERARLALEPGLAFGRPGAGHTRLNFGTTHTLLTDAVTPLATALG